MEAENIVNVATEVLDELRRSASRSDSPYGKANGEKVVEKRSVNVRAKRKTTGPVTSTPVESPAAANNGLTAISESYSETVVYRTSSDKETVIAGSPTKSRRSNRPKPVANATHVTNGVVKKSKEVTVVNDANNSPTKKKTAPVKEKGKVAETFKTSDYSSDEEEKYKTVKTYKTAGEWWNVFPKTDFTYSPASEFHTKEVAPGVRRVPNMSRRSLASLRREETTNTSFTNRSWSSTQSATRTNTAAADVKSRWFTPAEGMRIPPKLREADWASPDSDVDEVDEAVRASRVERSTSTSFTTFFTTLVTTVWTVVTTTWTSTVGATWKMLRGADAVAVGYTTPTRRTAAERTVWSKALDWLYVMCARVKVIDNRILAWFNPGSGFIDRNDRNTRMRCLLPLLLLPLLLFAGWWFCTQVAEEPLPAISNVISGSLASLANYLWFPFIFNRSQDHVPATAASFMPVTQHPSVDSTYPSFATLPTMSSNQIDIDTLTTRVINSHQMKLLLAANRQEIDVQSLVLKIINSEHLQTLIAANRNDVDVKSLTSAIVNSDEMQRWLATNRNDINIEQLTFDVLSSEQLQRLLAANNKDVDVDLLASRIVASGRLQEWVATTVATGGGGKEADVDDIVSQVVNSGRWKEMLAEQLAARNEDRQSLEDAETRKFQLQAELQRKDALLVEQQAALSQLSTELSRVKEHMTRLGERLFDSGAHVTLAHEDTRREAREETVRRQHSDAQLRREMRGLEGQLRLLQDHQHRLTRTMNTCCNKPPPALPLVAIEQHVSRFLAAALGAAGDLGADEMRAWIANVFVARGDLEARLANLTTANKQDLREASERSAETIMSSISDRISEQFVLQHQRQVAASHSPSTTHSYSDGGVAGTVVDGSLGLSSEQVRAIVNEALAKYDADKTGMVDHALESSGGQVISTRCSETYYEHSATLTLFGIPLWHKSNNPRSIIQPGVHPGECWAFRGSRGFAVIQLVGPVRISSFTLEHIPRSLAFAGNIDSAPKDFTVLGLNAQTDPEPTLLGKYTYQQNGTSLQHFIVQRTDLPPFRLIELQIESNHGNMEYTCLYRFRVHGTWIPE